MARSPASDRRLLSKLNDAAAPIYAVDSGRRIVFANRALGTWLGIEVQQLVGQRCDYRAASKEPITAVCAALCPPPEAFAGQITDASVSRLAAESRPFERRPARFLPLPGTTAADDLLIVVVQPTEAVPPEPADDRLAPERLHAMLVKLRSELGRRFHSSQLVGQSAAIARVREQVRVASDSGARVLVVGPRGSGREQIARTIHYGQKSSSIGPLVPIACELVDAEQMQASLASLLRRERDTPSERPGAALLLDVDRLRPAAQQELAGFLHLPGVQLHALATSRVSLQRLVASGKFHGHLAHELATLTITLPPLAKRREDIPLLAQHFLEEANAAGGKQLAGFQPASLELLAGLPWKGNLDELARAVREACARVTAARVGPADFPDWVRLAKGAAGGQPRDEQSIVLDDFLAEIEKELLARALKRARGNKSKAAQLLGLTRQRLLRRLAQCGLAAPADIEEPIVFEPLPDQP
jgi:Sigma-54 interaction domain/Bacterial regulatory protein, Fis family